MILTSAPDFLFFDGVGVWSTAAKGLLTTTSSFTDFLLEDLVSIVGSSFTTCFVLVAGVFALPGVADAGLPTPSSSGRLTPFLILPKTTRLKIA